MSKQKVATLTSNQALERLIEGNKRYVTGRQIHPHQNATYRAKLIEGQHPWAIMLGCPDSRVPPEIIFDQGLGDLFVIRVAGNIVDDIVIGRIEYAGEHLLTPLIMVLGHSKCGAVTAKIAGGTLPGHISTIASIIRPAVDCVKDQPGDLVENAIRANCLSAAKQLRQSKPVLAELIHDGKLRIVAARYDLETGIVELLE